MRKVKVGEPPPHRVSHCELFPKHRRHDMNPMDALRSPLGGCEAGVVLALLFRLAVGCRTALPATRDICSDGPVLRCTTSTPATSR
jgi:hypothetical protein